MSRLALYLLGPPRIERVHRSAHDGEVVQIGRRKALALLAYLAVTGRRQSRDRLAALFWPDHDQRAARGRLRRTLSTLSRILGDGFLTADRDTVSLDPDSEWWLDVDQFRQGLASCEEHGHPGSETCPDCLAYLSVAAELYQDDFMADFTLPDSQAFDDWQRYQTDVLRDELASVLGRLARCRDAQAEVEPAIVYARRWLELDPLHEPAHRRLMELFARAGRRGAALRQYRQCVRLFEEELGVPPSAETTALYESLRAGREVTPPISAPSRPQPPPPAFLRDLDAPTQIEKPVFVPRERELAQLDCHLEEALAGHGKVVFVTGGPGRGKTALIGEFARRALDAHPDLLVASGTCNAYSGAGDPYLPFRDALAMLTGDVEGRWAAGALSRGHARRLWDVLPLTVQTLIGGARRVYLRLERVGARVRALCSADGEAWFTLGQVDFPLDDGPFQVGLHAIGRIYRGIYYGAFPEGTAVRFESFTLWEL